MDNIGAKVAKFYKSKHKYTYATEFKQLIKLNTLYVRLCFPNSKYITTATRDKLHDLFQIVYKDSVLTAKKNSVTFSGRVDSERLGELHQFCNGNLSATKSRKVTAFFPEFNFIRVSALASKDCLEAVSKEFDDEGIERMFGHTPVHFSHSSTKLVTNDVNKPIWKTSSWFLFPNEKIFKGIDAKDEKSGFKCTLIPYKPPPVKPAPATGNALKPKTDSTAAPAIAPGSSSVADDKIQTADKPCTVPDDLGKDGEEDEECFKALVWNCRGAASNASIADISSTITGYNPQLTILTETNNINNQFHQTFNPFNQPNKILAVSNGKGTGVAIIAHTSRIKIKPILLDKSGRFILFNVNYVGGHSLNMLAVYAPASYWEKKSFPEMLLSTPELWCPNRIDLICGDLNCVPGDCSPLSVVLDSLSDEHDLVDLGQTVDIPTYRSPITGIARRIDRAYAKCSLLNNSFKVVPNALSDHAMLSFSIPTGISSKLPPTPWRLDRYTAMESVVNSTELSSNIRTKASNDLLLLQSEEHSVRDSIRKMNQQLHGEVPSKMLTTKLSQSKKDSSIPGLYRGNKSVTSDIDEMTKIMHRFYSKLFAAEKDNPELHAEMLKRAWDCSSSRFSEIVGIQFTIEEVADIILSSNPHKSPGPDGLGLWFYREHIDTIAPILTTLFNKVLTGEQHIPQNFKVGVITTIFKKGDIYDPANRRPITLLNCDYKILSKSINERLKPEVEKVVSVYQTGFVKNRYIMDNIITMKEIIDYCKQRGIKGLITLFDFNKAFDSISHGSIRRTLLHVGTPIHLVELIMNMISGSTAQVLVNGFLTDPIALNRGTKQGDPLSATLFVLVIECLSRCIRLCPAAGLPINDHGHALKINQFADDSATYSPSFKDLNTKLRMFDMFCDATSSLVNATKKSRNSITYCLGTCGRPTPIRSSTPRNIKTQ
ncbi:Pol [Heterostelium album PN500]|uniref:Pol n=1 Tax=Heterostelium pallidum (strain ATCC 26659 / Pp 5 / PN500) TaxID=670386 RepID=D3B9Z8_HETP5|nr:Pol [Heterostelium album PN500]EFA81385.1 Pol [Heterostelium album PN500]|eukprot:XP_020433503.1 Pol [Heterostelium album PN500]